MTQTNMIQPNQTEQKEASYGILIVEVNELDHAKLAQLNPAQILMNIGKGIEACLDKNDKIFNRYYTNQEMPVQNKALVQMTDAFVIVAPLSTKKELQKLTAKITAKLADLGVRTSTGIAEYGIDGLDYQELVEVATKQAAHR